MLQTTPARVAAPLTPGAAEEAIPDEELGWEPRALLRAVNSRRTYRIPVIVLTLAVAAGAYAGAAALLRLPVAHAEDARNEAREALTAVLEVMPGLREAADDLTGPQGPRSAESTAVLARVEGLAGDLRTAAHRPDPLLPPGLPIDDLALLEPIHSRMGRIAERLSALGSVLTDVADYRGAMEQMFVLPDLPGPDEGPSVEVFSERLAQMTATTVAAVALLPDGELFAAHRNRVADLVAWLPEWQAAYVEALRNDDLAAGEALRAEAAERVAALRAGLDALLAETGAWAAGEITEIVFAAQSALVLTG